MLKHMQYQIKVLALRQIQFLWAAQNIKPLQILGYRHCV